MKEKKNKIFVVDPHISNANGSRKDSPIDVFIDKMGQVMNYAREYNADIYIAGDMTDEPILKNENLDRIIDFYEKNKDINTFVIYGNHDEFNNNKELRNKTSLNLLFKTVPNLMKYPSCDKNTDIFGVDYLDGLTLENIEKVNQKIVMAHSFYNNEFYGHNEQENITKEKAEILNGKGVEILFLGHDHEEHSTVTIGNLKIFRIGNLYRKHKKNYNLARKIKVLLVKEDLTHEELIIKAPTFVEVLTANKLNKIQVEETDERELIKLVEEYKFSEEEDFLSIIKEKVKEKKDSVKIKISKFLPI